MSHLWNRKETSPEAKLFVQHGINMEQRIVSSIQKHSKNIQIDTTAKDIRGKKTHTERITKSTLNTNIFVKFAFVDSCNAAELKIRWHAHDIQWIFFSSQSCCCLFFGYFQCSFGVHVMCVLFDIYIYILKEVKCNAYVMQLIDLFSFAFKWTLYVKYAIIIVFTIKSDNFKCFIYMN